MKRANGQGSIYYDKRRKRYVARVTVGRRATGSLIRRQRSARTKREAKLLLKELLETRAQEAARPVTVAAYVREYAEVFKKPRVRATTWLNYLSILARVDAHFSGLALAALTPVALQRAVNEEKSRCTAQRLLVLVRGAMRQAYAEGRVDRDPTVGVRAPAPAPKKSIVVPTLDETRRLVRAADAPALRMAIQIQFATGMRAEEVLGLTWQDVDLENRQLFVRQVTNQVGRAVFIAPPKSRASRRTVALPSLLVADMARYRAWQDARRETAGANWREPPEGQFICTSDGAPIGIRTYERAFRKAAKNAALAVTPHTLRHAHATMLIAAGWSPKDVQERLGHASVRVTLDTYTHPLPERSRKIADWLDGVYLAAER